jgi:hypothetical protein
MMFFYFLKIIFETKTIRNIQKKFNFSKKIKIFLYTNGHDSYFFVLLFFFRFYVFFVIELGWNILVQLRRSALELIPASVSFYIRFPCCNLWPRQLLSLVFFFLNVCSILICSMRCRTNDSTKPWLVTKLCYICVLRFLAARFILCTLSQLIQKVFAFILAFTFFISHACCFFKKNY